MDHKEVARLHHQGISTSEIARRLGVSRGAVQKSIKKQGSSDGSSDRQVVAPEVAPIDEQETAKASLAADIKRILAIVEHNSLLLRCLLNKSCSSLSEGLLGFSNPGLQSEDDNHFVPEAE